MTERPDEAELERLGLYDPAGDGAADRLQLLSTAFELGADVDEVAAAVRVSGLGPLILDLVTRPPGPTLDIGPFAESAGVDQRLLRRLWSAFGLPDEVTPLPVRVTPDAADALRFTAAMTDLFGEDQVLAIARVVGSSTARLAEAVSGAFRVAIEVPQRDSGISDSEVVNQYASDAREILPLFLDTVAAVFRRHLVLVSYQRWGTDVDGAAVTLERTVGFVDLVGSTVTLRGQSVKQLSEMVRQFEAQVWELVVRAGGRVVKLIGDEAMFVLTDPSQACDVSLSILEDSEYPVRVGLAHGPVAEVYGDYYGETVNLAARLVHEARPSTLLLSRNTRDRVVGAFRLADRGTASLKGFDDPVSVYECSRSESG